jgi:hypothetical protein
MFQQVRRTFSELRDDINSLAAGFLQGCRGMLLYCTDIPFLTISVADPDPGSGAFLTPGSGIRSD